MDPIYLHCGTPDAPAPAPAAIVRPPVFLPEEVRVSDAGEHVEFAVGNGVLTMHYEAALKISQMLRLHAKRAKRRAGDLGRHWSAVALLDDVADYAGDCRDWWK